MKPLAVVVALLTVPLFAAAESPAHCAAHGAKGESPAAQKPYAGEQVRTVKSLSDADTEALQTGAGMGLAKAAELNHYPGPKHAIDLAAELALSDDQLAASRAAFEAMKRDATATGREIVSKEAALDALFAAGRADEARVAESTAEIAILYGKLRATHLAAHLRMREIMTPHQIAAYDRLLGYTR